MDCESFSEIISACADDEISQIEMDMLEEHIKICPACRETLAVHCEIKKNISVCCQKAESSCRIDLSASVMNIIKKNKGFIKNSLVVLFLSVSMSLCVSSFHCFGCNNVNTFHNTVSE